MGLLPLVNVTGARVWGAEPPGEWLGGAAVSGDLCIESIVRGLQSRRGAGAAIQGCAHPELEGRAALGVDDSQAALGFATILAGKIEGLPVAVGVGHDVLSVCGGGLSPPVSGVGYLRRARSLAVMAAISAVLLAMASALACFLAWFFVR